MAIISSVAPLPPAQSRSLPQSAPQETRQQNTAVQEPALDQAKADTLPVEEEQLSPKFAALARKERALRQQVQEFKAKEEALKAKEAGFQSSEALMAKFKADPWAFISEQGVTYDDLTNRALNQPSQSDQAYQKLQAEIQALKDSQLQANKKQEEQQTANYEHAVNQIRNDAKTLIDSDEAYSTIKDTDNVESVVELIKEHFNQKNELLTVQEAAAQVEDYLLEEALKYARLKKVQSKLNPAPETPVPGAKQTLSQAVKQQPTPTLTNAASATSSSKSLTPKERRERAIAAFKGQLK